MSGISHRLLEPSRLAVETDNQLLGLRQRVSGSLKFSSVLMCDLIFQLKKITNLIDIPLILSVRWTFITSSAPNSSPQAQPFVFSQWDHRCHAGHSHFPTPWDWWTVTTLCPAFYFSSIHATCLFTVPSFCIHCSLFGVFQYCIPCRTSKQEVLSSCSSNQPTRARARGTLLRI